MQYPGPFDTVRVRNDGHEPFVGKYDNQTYRIMPRSEGFIPFAASCLWFGHPASIDVDARNRHRTNEVERLRVRYGVYEANMVKDIPGIEETPGLHGMDPTADAFLTMTPDVKVFTVSGDPIITVIEDPDGNAVSPETLTRVEHQRDQLTMQEMRDRMAEMEAMMRMLTSEEAALADGGNVEGDGPNPHTPPPVSPHPLSASSTTPETTKVGRATSPGTGVTTGRGARPRPSSEVTKDEPDKVKVSP